MDPVRAEKMDRPTTTSCWRTAGCTSSAPSATSRGASTASCAVGAGRQGDPGATQFFLSLEDDLMRLFGSERIANVMDRMGAQEGEVITHGLVTKSIERAQKRVELNNFEARKRLLDYDDVMNQQREVIYDLRLFALEGGEDLKGEIWEMIEHSGREDAIDEYVPPGPAPGALGPGGAAAPDPAGPVRGGRASCPRRTTPTRARPRRGGGVGARGAPGAPSTGSSRAWASTPSP